MHLINIEWFKEVLNWVSNHYWLSILFVCTVSAAESLAVVGLFIPGILMMGAIGGLVYNQSLPFWSTMLAAIVGAVIGDGLSYLLGWLFKERLLECWPFSRFPKWLIRGQQFFANHGGKSIILGRFVGPVRPFVPVVAGMMKMAPRQFLLANIFSAILWAPIYMFPGWLLTHIVENWT